MESMRNHEQIFTKLMRRYKYLEKMFEEEMKKVLVFIRGFTPLERIKLARMTALWIGELLKFEMLYLFDAHGSPEIFLFNKNWWILNLKKCAKLNLRRFFAYIDFLFSFLKL